MFDAGLSVVMPVLDEERRIGQSLRALADVPGIDEVVVVDGGSRDRTAQIVEECPSVRLVRGPRGRGPQLNAGARAATGTVLLFLHADVSLPLDAAVWVARTLDAPGVVAGAFRTHTVADRATWLTPFLWLADLRSRVPRLPYGDQALFVRREMFEAIGGFPEQPLMEDVELARRLWGAGRVVTVPARVQVSARRFTAGPLRAILAMRLFPMLYRLGVSPKQLVRPYGNPR